MTAIVETFEHSLDYYHGERECHLLTFRAHCEPFSLTDDERAYIAQQMALAGQRELELLADVKMKGENK